MQALAKHVSLRQGEGCVVHTYSMTDRHAGYVVTLADDLRKDDSEAVLNALRQIRGVVAVEPVTATLELHVARARAQSDIKSRLFEALKEIPL